jgi:hypothetical protein
LDFPDQKVSEETYFQNSKISVQQPVFTLSLKNLFSRADIQIKPHIEKIQPTGAEPSTSIRLLSIRDHIHLV